MPSITINGTAIEFQPGATILEAALARLVLISPLSAVPKLPFVGNCRVCLVSVKGQSKLGCLPALSPATEGMEIETGVACQPWPTGAGCLACCWSATPATISINGGREHPANEFERYVLRYDVPVGKPHEMGLRGRRRAPR